MEEEEELEGAANRRHPKPNPFGFTVPLTKEEILEAERKK